MQIGYGDAYGGVWRSVFDRSLESGGQFCVGAFGKNLASVAVKMFSYLIYFTKKFYKFCSFNAICKDNAAISCIRLCSSQKVFIPVNFHGSYLCTCVF
jgi:hypothetical protein